MSSCTGRVSRPAVTATKAGAAEGGWRLEVLRHRQGATDGIQTIVVPSDDYQGLLIPIAQIPPFATGMRLPRRRLGPPACTTT